MTASQKAIQKRINDLQEQADWLCDSNDRTSMDQVTVLRDAITGLQKAFIVEESARVARSAKTRANRAAHKDALDSIGVHEVRGAMGGKYIE